MKEKYLGVDFGDARTGLALSEPTGLLAVGAGCIRCGNLRKTAEQTAAFAKEQGVAKIIIGKPLNMNGTEGPRCEGFPWNCLTSGSPPYPPTGFCPTPASAAKSEKIPWTSYPPR